MEWLVSCEVQGRQYHMWFGHGTGPGKGEDGPFGPTEIGERIAAVAQGAIAALPADPRARAGPATARRRSSA